MLQDIDRRENDFTHDVKDMPYEKFSEWCKLQYEYANGRQLPAGYVPQSIYQLHIDGESVGIGKIRWKLTESSQEAGGKILVMRFQCSTARIRNNTVKVAY